jgi:predicted TIM-barrel fold metal-dependent hydrolase
MRTITLEEHFVTPGFLEATGAYGNGAPALLAMQQKLLDLGDGRIADMDEAGVDLQVLSLAAIGLDELAAAIATPLVCDVNDELAAAVQANPKRFAGLATLAMKDPAKELERCIDTLGFKV